MAKYRGFAIKELNAKASKKSRNAKSPGYSAGEKKELFCTGQSYQGFQNRKKVFEVLVF